MSSRLTSPQGDFSGYQIHPGPAHAILAQTCLGFLLHLDNRIDLKSVEAFPLAKYAARYWVYHAQFEDVASRIKDGMETLFDSDKPHFEAWIGIHDIDYSPRYFWDPEVLPNPNPLYYAAICGFYDLVEQLAVKHPQHINAICGKCRFPLLVALRGYHFEVAELLLEHGANIDARETTGGTILLVAMAFTMSHNLVDIVRFLLEQGADVNARDGSLRSSLHLVKYDDLEVVQVLLKHNADVN